MAEVIIVFMSIPTGCGSKLKKTGTIMDILNNMAKMVSKRATKMVQFITRAKLATNILGIGDSNVASLFTHFFSVL